MIDDLISRKAVIEAVDRHTRDDGALDDDISVILEEVETAFDKEKVIEELKGRTSFLQDCTKYGNKDEKQMAQSYSTMMLYEVAQLVDDLIEIVEKGGIE